MCFPARRSTFTSVCRFQPCHPRHCFSLIVLRPAAVEPRYRVLIRRAWEGERRFLWADAAPRPPDAVRALLISVEDARFLPDGCATASGRAVERVAREHSWVEEGTGGLWYAGSGPDADDAAAARSATSGGRGDEDPVGAATVALLLQAAISRGAPAYNRGDARGCAELYLATARALLADDSRRDELPPAAEATLALQQAVARASTFLAEAGEPTASRWRKRRQADAAAWALRHAFDRILDDRIHAVDRPMPTPAAEAPAELPVFYFPGLSLGVGARASFVLFEPRYLLMAEECRAGGGLLLCASVPSGAAPRSGRPAMLARMQACTRTDGRRLRASLVGVRHVSLGAVREDAQKAGLWYAQVALGGRSVSALAAEDGETSNRRSGNCTIC